MRSTERIDSLPIAVHDEGLHPAGPEPEWQESVFLAWRDSSRGVGGNHRIGMELNRNTSNLWCGVYTDPGLRFRANHERLPLSVMDEGRSGIAAGGQQLYHDGRHLR